MSDGMFASACAFTRNIGGTMLMVAAAAALTMTLAISLMVVAVGAGTAGVAAVAGAGLMDSVPEQDDLAVKPEPAQ